MQSRYLVSLWLIGVLLILTGCDPKKMIEQKVPGALKDAMSSERGKKGKAEQKEQEEKVEISISAPARNAVFPVAKEIVFQAKVVVPSAPAAQKPVVTWKLYRGTAIKQGFEIGRGERVSKKLDAGDYKVSASLNFKNREKVATTAFRVANTIEGSLTDSDGAALPGVTLMLSQIEEDKPLKEARSGKDGNFSVEVPAEGFFKLVPKKEGYSFFPYRRIVKFTDPAVMQTFKGTKGQITDLKITEDPTGEKTMESVCPLEQRYVSFAVKSDSKPASVETQLVGVRDGKEHIITLEDASENPIVKQDIHPEGTVLKLQIPSTMVTGPAKSTYRLRLTVQDEKNNRLSAEAPEALDYDIVNCFQQVLTDGVELQKEGKLEAAVKSYKLLEKLNNTVDDPSQFRKIMEQSTFNRGLAFLAMALAKPKDDIDRETLLVKAKKDFEGTLRRDKADLDARLFLGLTMQLAGQDKIAVRLYDKIIQQEPRYPGVRELRALAVLNQVQQDLKAKKRCFESGNEFWRAREGVVVCREILKELTSRREWYDSNSKSSEWASAWDKFMDKLGESMKWEDLQGKVSQSYIVDVFHKGLDEFQKQLKRELLLVADDLTEAIKSRPEDESLRHSRRAVLKAAYDLQEEKVDLTKLRANILKLLQNELPASHLDHPALMIDVSNIQRPDTEKVADPGKYVRK